MGRSNAVFLFLFVVVAVFFFSHVFKILNTNSRVRRFMACIMHCAALFYILIQVSFFFVLFFIRFLMWFQVGFMDIHMLCVVLKLLNFDS